jgi:hypothetical protein
MQVQVFTNGFEMDRDLKAYAETRAWRALQRFTGRVSWVGMQLTDGRGKDPTQADAGTGASVVCQIDVWLRGLGLVTLKHTDADAYVAVDRAVVRLQQAVARRIRESGSFMPAPSSRIGESRISRQDTPDLPPNEDAKLAVVLTPVGKPAGGDLKPWLQRRYGIEQVRSLTISDAEWDELAGNVPESGKSTHISGRLALARLSKPALFVVAGHQLPSGRRNRRPRWRHDVAAVVRRIRSWGVANDVVGVWMSDVSGPEECFVAADDAQSAALAEDDRIQDSPHGFVVSASGT